jgi:signal transduction histidine kinase
MLHEFLSTHRDAILARTLAIVPVPPVPLAPLAPLAPPGPRATLDEIDGIPLFLDQLTDSLRAQPRPSGAMVHTAAAHGLRLLERGFTVAQVVHDYGGVCQAVTELAHETHAPITADEFRIFNRCLDDAIAGAVTAFTGQREKALTDRNREQLGELAHELRNAIGAATVAFEVVRMGKVGLQGSTADVLGRSLSRIAALVDGSLTHIRLESGGAPSLERVSMRQLVLESAAYAGMEASTRGLTFHVEAGEPDVEVMVDRQLLTAALANLLQNALKFTAPGSRVSLVVRATDERVVVEVADECGGLPPGAAADLFRPFQQRGADRSGLGLGLSITRKSVEAHGGLLQVRNIPGLGCVFSIDLPRA